MTDPDSNLFSYAYNGDGNLEYVTFPPDAPNPAPVRQYHYGDPGAGEDPELVVQITDENGDIYKTISYDSEGRALSSGLSDGTFGHTTFDYTNINDPNDPRIRVTNSLGREAVYSLESHSGTVKVKQVEGADQLANLGCSADMESKTFYPEYGWVMREVDKAGIVTYYEYYTDTDRYGLVKKRVEGEGSPEERTFLFDWYIDSRLQMNELLVGVHRTAYEYFSNGKLKGNHRD